MRSLAHSSGQGAASIPTETLIAAIAKDRADWLVDAVACATQDRRFLRGDPAEDEGLTEVLFLNAEKAIRTAIERASSSDWAVG